MEREIKKDVVEIMKEAYLNYALSVIVSRALPDVRDGLKPVQRRILYSMYEMGLKADSKFRKSATIVGECFVKDTLILTKQGLVPIQNIKVGDLVYTQNGLKRVVRLYEMPERELLKVTLENGLSNIVTPSQKFKVLTEDWKFEWKEAKDLTENDYLLVKADYPEIKELVRLNRVKENQPQFLNENIAYLLGILISDGWVSNDYGRKKLPRIGFGLGDAKEGTAKKIVSIFKKEFNYTPTIEKTHYQYKTKEGKVLNNKRYQIRINRKAINEFFVSNFELEGLKTPVKKIPSKILQSPKSVIFSFISGLIDGDGSVNSEKCSIQYVSTSEKLIDGLLVLLLHQGIFGKKYILKLKEEGKIGERTIKGKYQPYVLEVRGKNAIKLAKHLNLASEKKRLKIQKIIESEKIRRNFGFQYEIIPYAGKMLFEELSQNHLGGGWYQDINGNKFRMGIKYQTGCKIRYSSDLWEKPLRKTQVIEWGIKNKLERIGSPLFEFLENIIKNKIYFLRVASIEKVAPEKTYDFEVETDHEFVANGVISHNCMGKYHPHGDAPIYEALVRMAQPFSLRYPLILGQGNFGSLDDPSEFASMRYTEAKLSKFGEEMLKDIEKETVPFSPNYDGTRKEPQVLPSPLPNILLNGALGIAVGMATNILPHNLCEIVDALLYLLKTKKPSLSEILKIVKGPDLPTGGELFFHDKKEQIYKTGQGQVIVRARAKIEGQKIIFWEVPYLTKKSELLQEIAEKVKEGKISGIKLLRDESDREGIRIVIEVQKGIDPEKFLEILYQQTSFQKSFNLNFVVLTEGVQPRLLGLLEILEQFLEHRKKVIVNKTRYELKILKERLHILEGLKKCLNNIDLVIKIIKNSPSRTEAQKKLMKEFKIDEIQANAILETKLGTLTKLEKNKIEKEFEEKKRLEKELSQILKSEEKVKALLAKELEELKQKYGDERRTLIRSEKVEKAKKEELILAQDTLLIFQKNNFLKRLDLSFEKIKEKKAEVLVEKEEILKILPTNTQNDIILFSNYGRFLKIPVFEIPEKKGKPIFAFWELKQKEKVREILEIKKEEKEKYLVLITERGIVKKMDFEIFQKAKRKRPQNAISLKNGDFLVGVSVAEKNDFILVATQEGQVILFSEKEVKSQKREAEGVRAIKLSPEDKVVSLLPIKDLKKEEILFVTENGFLKRTKISFFKVQKRGGKGIRGIKISSKTGKLVAAKRLSQENFLFLFSQNKIFKIPISQVPLLKRENQGKRLIKISPQEKVVAVALI